MPNQLLLAGLKGIFKAISSMDRPAPPWDPGSIRSILVINTTALGDTLFSTPAIRALRREFPRARLVSLAGRTAKEILLNSPHLDTIIDHPGRVNLPFLFHLPKLLKEIRKEKCDLAVILDGNDPDAVPLAYLSGARYRLGWQGSRLAFLLTHPLRFDIPGKHHIQMWEEHLLSLGIQSAGAEMEVALSVGEEEAAGRFLIENNMTDRSIIGLHPFANKLHDKLWPLERVVELGALLSEEGHIPLLFGGPREKDFADQMVLKSDQKIVSAAGRLTLRQTMALIKRCDLFITLDSGPLHIAQALGVPTIALFGPSDPQVTGPLGPSIIIKNEFECSPCGWLPCPHEVACMKSIQVRDVLEAVRSIRDRFPGPVIR